MKGFRDTLEFSSLSSIPTIGQNFTWSNNRRGLGFIEEKLDQTLSNPKGMEAFSSLICHVLPALKSNHSPLLISISGNREAIGKTPFIFRYKASWDLYAN